jgi:hypothetical protein
MKRRRLLKVAAIAVLASVLVPATVSKSNAQQYDATWTCHDVGVSAPEPLGAQPGPVMIANDYLCVATSGPMNGGVDTGRAVSVFDKSGGKLVTGTGIIRKPDATAVYLMTDQKLELLMSEGKVVGVTGTGHGRYVLAEGSAAPLSGKTFTIDTKTTGPHQFIVNEKYE